MTALLVAAALLLVAASFAVVYTLIVLDADEPSTPALRETSKPAQEHRRAA